MLAGSTECFGGLLLLIGLGSRLISIPLAFTMVVAYLTAHREELGMIFSDTEKFTAASPFLFLLVSLIVMIFGPGIFSLDTLIARIFPTGKKRN
jgi:putative oxidoreductase